jgi:hypothetical protein
MKEPWIKIPGFRGYDYSNAVEPCETNVRTYIRQCLEVKADGQYFADAHVSSSGDTLILIMRNKRTGQCEIYDLKIRAHYMEEGDFPMPGAGKVVKAD